MSLGSLVADLSLEAFITAIALSSDYECVGQTLLDEIS